MTIQEVLHIDIQTLSDIRVPVAQMQEIGQPIQGVINDLNAIIGVLRKREEEAKKKAEAEAAEAARKKAEAETAEAAEEPESNIVPLEPEQEGGEG